MVGVLVHEFEVADAQFTRPATVAELFTQCVYLGTQAQAGGGNDGVVVACLAVRTDEKLKFATISGWFGLGDDVKSPGAVVAVDVIYSHAWIITQERGRYVGRSRVSLRDN